MSFIAKTIKEKWPAGQHRRAISLGHDDDINDSFARDRRRVAATISFTPQAWRIIRTGETHAISSGMYVITVVGFSLWMAYGVKLGQWPLVASNSICLLLSGFILIMKMVPRHEKKCQ